MLTMLNTSNSPKKKISKETYTHTEFLDYIDPFFEPLKEKHLQYLKTEVIPKNFNFKKESYSKWIDQLKDKLCSYYLFDDSIDFAMEDSEQPAEIITDAICDTSKGNGQSKTEAESRPAVAYTTPLTLVKNIKFKNDRADVFEELGILESYRLSGFTSLINEYKAQVNRNNQRRKTILDVLDKRARYSGYFHAYDLVKKELEDIQRKRILSKKKKRQSEFEDETIKEYLDRLNEFYEHFGAPEEISDPDYSDLFKNGVTPLENLKDLQFFE